MAAEEAKPAAVKSVALESKLNLSLDDIIKQEDKTGHPRKQQHRGGGRDGSSGGSRQHGARGQHGRGGPSNGIDAHQHQRHAQRGADGRGRQGRGGYPQQQQQHQRQQMQQGRGGSQQQLTHEGAMFIPAHLMGQLAAHLPGMGMPNMGPGFGMPPHLMGGMPPPHMPPPMHGLPSGPLHPHHGRQPPPHQRFGAQQQQQHQQQQQQPPAQPAQPAIIVERLPEQYRNAVQVYEEEETGDVVAQFRRKHIVRVHPSGEVVLDAAGLTGQPVFQALNEVLQRIGLKVVAIGDVSNGTWNVSDGRSSQRFSDGMVVPAKGPASAGRAKTLLAAFKDVDTSDATEAEAASTAAAIAAGLLPPEAAAAASRPSGGGGGQWRGRGRGEYNGGSGFSRQQHPGRHAANGHAPTGQDAEIRRLKAQGRWAPY